MFTSSDEGIMLWAGQVREGFAGEQKLRGMGESRLWSGMAGVPGWEAQGLGVSFLFAWDWSKSLRSPKSQFLLLSTKGVKVYPYFFSDLDGCHNSAQSFLLVAQLQNTKVFLKAPQVVLMYHEVRETVE